MLHAPGLGAIAVDSYRITRESLGNEVWDHAPVVGAHPGPVGVEDACYTGVYTVVAVVGHSYRLGVALRLVVDAADAQRIDVAPVLLGLGMDQRVAVDLARGGEHHTRAFGLG